MDASQVAIRVMAFRDEPCRMLARWLRWAAGQGADVGYAYDVRPLDLAREQVANAHLADWRAGSPRRYLLMIDVDVCPTADSRDALLAADGPLVYLGYCGHQGSRGHVGDGDFGCGASRIDAEALALVPKPWFRFDLEHDVLAACECDHFRRRAASVAIESRMVGIAWHLQTIAIRPAPSASPGIVSAWPVRMYHESPEQGGTP